MMNVRHNAGLSLVEMLVVVSIIAVLAGVVLVITLRVENQSKEHATANVFALLRSALQEYYEDTNAFPPQPERDSSKAAVHIELMYSRLSSVPASLQILGRVDRTFIKVDTTVPAAVPRVFDPWGTVLDYFYSPDSQFPELISAGPDKTFGTLDDINSRDM